MFLRQLIEGSASRSYGIQVARLAGLPAAVVERSKRVLSTLQPAVIHRRYQLMQGRSRPRQMVWKEIESLHAATIPAAPSAIEREVLACDWKTCRPFKPSIFFIACALGNHLGE